jgi:hypothetical protein
MIASQAVPSQRRTAATGQGLQDVLFRDRQAARTTFDEGRAVAPEDVTDFESTDAARNKRGTSWASRSKGLATDCIRPSETWV